MVPAKITTSGALERWSTVYSFDSFWRFGGKIADPYRNLIDPSHKLLQRLSAKIPGTFRHSLLVGGVAAIAAFGIKANPDIARVVGYYHDIAKLLNLDLFSEAVSGSRQGARIITTMQDLNRVLNHPVCGARYLWKRWGFPEEIWVAIAQHHGTTKTKLMISRAILDGLSADSLRYPGPIPESKEAAIVMIADSVEAFFHKLSHDPGWSVPTPAYMQSKVAQVVRQMERDGQFVDSGLTPEELTIVEQKIIGEFYGYYTNKQYP